MDTKLKIVFLLAITTVNAGLIVVAPKILAGPSSRTVLVGPDGSQISAIIPGGRIVLEGGHGPLLQGTPQVIAVASVAQPLPVPVVATLPVSTEVVNDTAVPAVEIPGITSEIKTDVEDISVEAAEDGIAAKSGTESKVETVSEDDTVASTEEPQDTKVASEETLQIVENSSTNSTSNELPSETSTSAATPTNSQEGVAVKSVESPVVLSYLRDSSLIVPENGDIEGQYVPDNLEKQFDDGSYKPNEFLW